MHTARVYDVRLYSLYVFAYVRAVRRTLHRNLPFLCFILPLSLSLSFSLSYLYISMSRMYRATYRVYVCRSRFNRVSLMNDVCMNEVFVRLAYHPSNLYFRLTLFTRRIDTRGMLTINVHVTLRMNCIIWGNSSSTALDYRDFMEKIE